MDLFEYQGKQYFARFDIPVPNGGVADTVDEAVAHAEHIGYPVVVKAQVQVGGRGKAGGIQLANNADEARLHAGNILGMDIKGHTVRRLWIEEASQIQEEYYASFTLDRSAKLYLGMLSAQGGVEIEQVAAESPQAIARIHINPLDGLTEPACREWVAQAKLNPAATAGTVSILLKLYRAFEDGDADLVEINPLILAQDGRVYALDAKVTLDDAAAYRHEEWQSFGKIISEDERERRAQERGLQYVGLDGSIGIMANGAGLAMSTLDVVNQVGGDAANFLDIGGGSGADVVRAALEVINSDPKVKAIFINVFGGITRGEEVAAGIIEGMQGVELNSPVVVRLDGTNAEEGRAILAANATNMLYVEPTMLDGARKAVALAGGR
ncbi:MAG: ADP-forming succinate--CoA ligase subunit beta [Chloroflexi bacterium]|nr:ADP-forming succinate--CoA ligase subunit beta [Chloroflexota bacterium]